MKWNFKFGHAVTVIPTAAAEKIISGAANRAEAAVLLALASDTVGEYSTEAECTEALSAVTGLDASEVTAALAFWRGASVITLSQKGRAARSGSSPEKRGGDSGAPSDSTAEQAAVSAESGTEGGGGNEKNKNGAVKRSLMREEVRKYDPDTMSAVLKKDGGALATVIEQCQQIMGWVFNPTEVSVIVGLNDYLGLAPDYILTMCAYYAKKKPNCKMHYIEKVAYTLVNDGITTTEALDAHIKGMELYDGIAGALRKKLGIGAREFTRKENIKINHWINDLGYGSELIDLAYEITVDSIGEFNFEYADRILNGWALKGAKTVDEAQRIFDEFKTAREKLGGKDKPAGGVVSVSKSSFNGDEFFELALQRSYAQDGKKSN